VGYLSSVFSSGADAHFIYPLIARHDREAFDVFCFNCSPGEDEMTARLRIVCDHWIDVRGVPGEQAAKMIRERGIDVLVVIGQPADACMQIAAMRCAPVQAVWLAFASATSGLRAMDYRIADEHLDPPGDAAAYFSEISLKLSKTAWCYHPLSEAVAVGAAPATSNGFITFGSFNRFGKINPRVVAAWSDILRGEPTARLMILAAAGSHRDRLLAEFGERGIDGGRIEFVDRLPREQYLRLYDRIDIFLDTFPYSGHTTALDSLWMGVPVVTLAGKTTVGRAACSALRNLGLEELVGQSAQEYVEIALRLGRDRVGLAKLRSSLRGRTQTSPLMDSAAFAREMEGLYLRMSGREKSVG
jgi:predicted O-linked N-acetylglucosamine transferase (SPINDLY family)